MRRHRQLTDQQIHQIGWIQAADPGATGGLRQIWIDTSSGPPYTIKQRNATDTGWDTLGSSAGASGAAGGDLAGTYPNPTVGKASAGFALSGGTIPTFTGSTVDYNPGAVSHVRWNGASAATLHGMLEGIAGQLMIIENATAAQILTVPNESATETTAARRFTGPDAADITLPPGAVGIWRYSGTSSRWELHARASVLVAGPDADISIDTAGAVGTAGKGARSGHGHKLNTYSSTPTSPALSGSAGTSGDAPARGSHVHPQAAPNVQVFTAGSGNWTKPAGARVVIVECVGGGGGSGGTAATASGTRGASGAGGGAGYSRKTFAASALASTEPYSVGAAGAAGAGGANDGGAGGDSTFGAVGYRVTGGGGQGGAGAAATSSAITQPGGAGGTASGGEINAGGQPGDSGRILAGPATLPIANGGNSIWGGGGLCGAGASGSAPSGGYGGGGGGTTGNASDAAHAGAAGAAGAVVVTTLF